MNNPEHISKILNELLPTLKPYTDEEIEEMAQQDEYERMNEKGLRGA